MDARHLKAVSRLARGTSRGHARRNTHTSRADAAGIRQAGEARARA